MGTLAQPRRSLSVRYPGIYSQFDTTLGIGLPAVKAEGDPDIYPDFVRIVDAGAMHTAGSDYGALVMLVCTPV